MQQVDDSETPPKRERHRVKRGKKNSLIYKPVDRELDRKSIEQQEHSQEMRRLDAIERNNH
ncbi:hypothetical protein ACSYAD_34195 [Acaryochloris marina NIES-2412]|uniref:hypothetical protein n=1 Tax=Acaryochloris marina TaxID=155978 RepID=UPI0040585CBA